MPVNVFKLRAGSENDVHAKGQKIIKRREIRFHRIVRYVKRMNE